MIFVSMSQFYLKIRSQNYWDLQDEHGHQKSKESKASTFICRASKHISEVQNRQIRKKFIILYFLRLFKPADDHFRPKFTYFVRLSKPANSPSKTDPCRPKFGHFLRLFKNHSWLQLYAQTEKLKKLVKIQTAASGAILCRNKKSKVVWFKSWARKN